MALGVACAGTGNKEALSLLEPMLTDATPFVQQVHVYRQKSGVFQYLGKIHYTPHSHIHPHIHVHLYTHPITPSPPSPLTHTHTRLPWWRPP